MARSKRNKGPEGTSSTGAFAKHAEQDEALQQPEGTTNSNDASPTGSGGLSMTGRVVVFFVFPVTAGTIGLYAGYLESIRRPDRTINFDRDFVMPFLLALTMAVIIFIQTGGFSSSKVKPLLQWPKIRRVRKIVRKKKGEAAGDQVNPVPGNKKDD